MAARRTLPILRPLLRTSSSAVISASHRLSPCPILAGSRPSLARRVPSLCSVHQHQPRYHSNAAGPSKVYTFADVSSLVDESPSPSRILIDVREPSEVAGGHIPTAQNMPIGSQPDGIFLPPDEFEARFGFPKPDPDAEVVFYCKAGVRSSAAAQLARQAGYQKVGEYRGSWLDWVKNGGVTETP